jgi:hypothetical protein
LVTDGITSPFAVSAQDVIRLLKAHGDKGGRFLADHLERRAGLGEWWTMIISGKEMEAFAHRGGRITFGMASDFEGNFMEAEVLDEDESEFADETAEDGSAT